MVYNHRVTYEKLAARKKRANLRPQTKNEHTSNAGDGKQNIRHCLGEGTISLAEIAGERARRGVFGRAGGTQVPNQVMDAVQNYFLTANANTYGAFLTSRRTDEMILSARARHG